MIAVDCGANVGVHTIEWAKHMTGWGVVLAIEAQERIYYALAGNVAINNCFNARAIHAAVTSQPGVMKMPAPNYFAQGSFGSLELRKRETTEFIGQPIDYSENKMVDVQTISLDSFNFPRLDLIKIDIEGMELEALAGGVKCIGNLRPILRGRNDQDRPRGAARVARKSRLHGDRQRPEFCGHSQRRQVHGRHQGHQPEPELNFIPPPLATWAAPRMPMAARNSWRVSACSRNTPSMRLVTMLTPVLCTPRVVMH